MTGNTPLLLASVLLFAVGAVLLAVSWWIARKRVDPSLCTARTEGTVVGGSRVMYAGHHTARVQYVVGGKVYEVDGPLFESGSAGSFMESNLTTRENLPRTLKGPIVPGYYRLDQRAGPIPGVAYQNSIVAKLYPMGSSATVYYNPENPSIAYVERHVVSRAPGILLVLGAVFLVSGLITAFFTAGLV